MKEGNIFLRILNLRSGEVTPFLYLLLHAFLSGFGIAISFIAIQSIFIESKGVKYLPLLFILSSILLLIGGLIYTRIEHKLGAFKAFGLVLAFCSVWAFATRFSFFAEQTLLVSALAFAAYYLVYLLCNLEFWGAAAIIFDVRQGKRLFGPLAAGESLAKILGYSVPVFFKSVSSIEDSLLVAGICFLLSYVILRLISRKYGHMAAHDEHAHSEEQAPLAFFTPSKILRTFSKASFSNTIAFFAMLASLILYVIFYGYVEQVQLNLKAELRSRLS